ncbi:MAG: VOC family protein [Acidimicrobiales bacterium]|jgi:catechol 2,3-dioxygenase-like lactoylglutathione lyase family enzyme|nr:VOC family protein [Acidimicrobiales bacterium]
MSRLALVSLVVPDYDEAIAFFVDVLGFELAEDRDEGRKRWIVVRPAGAETGVVLAQADTAEQRAAVGNQLGGRVGFFLHTDDFARDHARMTTAGVHFHEDPRHEPYGIVAVWEDPWGNTWDLLEPEA